MEFIATVIGLIILLFVIEKITTKVFSIKKEKVSGSTDNRIDRWERIIFFLLFLIILWFMTGSSDTQAMLYLLINLSLIYGYQAVKKFFFVRESRQYISAIVLLLVVLVSMYVLYQFPFLEN